MFISYAQLEQYIADNKYTRLRDDYIEIRTQHTIQRFKKNIGRQVEWIPYSINLPAYVENHYNVYKEIWCKGYKYHREDGPAHVIKKQGYYLEEWCFNGRLHRLDGPAILEINKNNDNYYCEKWYKNSKLHREDGPAYIIKQTYKHNEYWYINNCLHREDGPAKIENSNLLILTEWYKNGKLHREDGPAKIEIDNRTTLIEWYKNSRLHRSDGPAHTLTFDTGLTGEQWFYNGNEIDPYLTTVHEINNSKFSTTKMFDKNISNIICDYLYQTVE